MNYRLDDEKITEVVSRISLGLSQYCQEYDIHYLVTGVSGGLDSAVTIALAEKSCLIARENGFKLTSVGLIMPCISDPSHADMGKETIKKFNAQKIEISLDSVYDFLSENCLPDINRQIAGILKETGDPPFSDWDQVIAQGNIKARLRMMCGTYHVARMLNGIVLSTDNYSELLMGFWTLNGDVGDFGPIQYIFKGLELYDIAAFLKVPQRILDAKPTDGLGISAGDEDQLGTDYCTVDQVMIKLMQQGFDPDGPMTQAENLPEIDGIDPDLVKKLARRCLASSYKRKGCYSLNRDDLGLPGISSMPGCQHS